MYAKQQICKSLAPRISSVATAAMAIATVFMLAVLLQSAQAQTFTVIHSFNGVDGAFPQSGLTIAGPGVFYGTTGEGGGIYGNVFRLAGSPSLGWTLSQLYYFTGETDGNELRSGVIIGPDHALYGSTIRGGTGAGCAKDPTYGCGTVFRLAQPATAMAPWTENILYRFAGGSDGVYPQSDVSFDQWGNLYGTTWVGGSGVSQDCPDGCGVVYQLRPSGGGWTESVVWTFRDIDGEFFFSGVVADPSGNLYGVAALGGQYGRGAIYQLSPTASGWTHKTLYSFTGHADGGIPTGGLIFDASGNLYGTTSTGGSGGGGTVFELTPTHDGWNFNTLYTLPGDWLTRGGPSGKLVMDAAGNVYGTQNGEGAHGRGSVFKLTHSTTGWSYASLYDFTAQADGGWPTGSLVLDAEGNIYGMTTYGGTSGCYCGVIFKIAP